LLVTRKEKLPGYVKNFAVVNRKQKTGDRRGKVALSGVNSDFAKGYGGQVATLQFRHSNDDHFIFGKRLYC
jgi:hypothetical protein